MKIPNPVPLLGVVVSALLLVYVPLQLVQGVTSKSIDPVFAAVGLIASLVVGGVIAFFSLVFNLAEPFVGKEDPRERRELEKRLEVYRARQRAMLEELDEIKKLLEEIRDLLKGGMGV
ncbi:hypothetical protein [Thermofilum pendens]|uniref:Uncharacterized protein n=1 Tax=Thermofilum pendens (strain DSM 2475 / Hrk 5) TaxID=368408 RepID=A1RYF6_THEPD|nr:hypothetical protein [Thermofilum pendens]ABL78236.1 hypothetical protein Tpen_0835 [Thermofilum pendens Hrk 5]